MSNGALYGTSDGGLYGSAVYGEDNTLLYERDPVETIVLVLDDKTEDADYPNAGTKPAHIERTEATERRVKHNRVDNDAIYVQSRIESDFRKMGKSGGVQMADEVAVVTLQAWTVQSAQRAEQLLRDTIRLVARKADDTNTTTNWVDLWPQNYEDFTAQKDARRGDHYVKAVSTQLRDLRPTQ